MARLFPDDIDATSANARLEAATALRLRDGSSRAEKNGRITVEGEEYVKHYGTHRRSVSQ